MLKLGIATPSYRALVHDHLQDQLANLWAACLTSSAAYVQRGAKDGLVLSAAGRLGVAYAGRLYQSGCSITLARNRFVYGALKLGWDWLLMCDSDTYWPGAPQAILAMVSSAHVQEAAVIAAPVLRRDGRYNILSEQGTSLIPEDFRGRTLRVGRAGAAFLALNLAWFRAEWPRQPWFRWEQTEAPDGEPIEISEDHVFCDGVRERGGAILCDGRLEPVHDGAPYAAGHPYAVVPPSNYIAADGGR